VSAEEGTLTFYSDGKAGGCLAENLSADVHPQGWSKYEVPCVRLRNYLIDSVEFLKMNIKSAEWRVLADSEDRLQQVREVVIEHHHLPGVPRTLNKILDLLQRQAFEYLVNGLNHETNPGL
jgi:hypothetical protein